MRSRTTTSSCGFHRLCPRATDLVRDVTAELISTTRSFVSMGALPLIFLLGLVIATIVAGLELPPATDDERRILITTGLTIVVSTVFAFGVGVG